MTGSRDKAWEKLRSRDQGHARRLCEGIMKVEATTIWEDTDLSYMVYTGDVRYCRSEFLKTSGGARRCEEKYADN